jgi:methionyl-tRNA formyltransferase
MPAAERFTQMASTHCPDVPHAYVRDFHAPDTLQRVRAMAPDLGVIVATHRLVPALFTLPRLGSINLHFGNAPEYRGSSPGFWELYDGTPEVGLTIHWVSEQLDAGDIILQERLPLDLVPPGDPLVYLADLWRDQLLPNGVRLLVDAVDRLSRGPVAARQQDAARARTRSFATWRDKRELRRRVAARRAGPAALRS